MIKNPVKSAPQQKPPTPDAAAVADLKARFLTMRGAFEAERYPSRAVRLSRLSRLELMLDGARAEIAEAISQDFSWRSPHETMLGEVLLTLGMIRHAKRQLKAWMRTKRVATAAQFWPGKNRLMRQPVGIVGVVSPWNYPLMLALGPTVAALAAGNRVLLKPSELTPLTTALLKRLVSVNFAANEFAVIEGDASIGRAFTELHFDHLLFTGSTAVGRSVALAAANNLTPVTLELGGKSPAIIDDSADLSQVIESLMFGKLLNAGQTCIAPDYVLLTKGRESEFAERARLAVAQMYPGLMANPDYSAIAQQRQFDRLEALVAAASAAGARVVALDDGSVSPDSTIRRMAPRVVFDVNDQMALMQEEIFGPILPVVSVDSQEQAIAYVNSHERPLALYWYGKDSARRDRVLRDTVSGGVTVNDTLLHINQEAQPFGGVGASGQGAYHGEFGFRTFSHEKPIFIQSRFNGIGLLRPPYGPRADYLIGLLRRIV